MNGRHVFNLVKVLQGVVPRSNSTYGFSEVSNQTSSQMRIIGGPAESNKFFLKCERELRMHHEFAGGSPSDR